MGLLINHESVNFIFSTYLGGVILDTMNPHIKEIQNVRFRFKSNEKFHLVEPLKIQKDEKVSISKILNGVTYCEDPLKDREKLKEIYKKFDTLNDYRLDLVMTSLALKTLETRNIFKHGLEIFVAKGDDLGSLLNRCYKSGIVGEMNHSFNILFMSKVDNPKNFNLVFSHEIIHKLQRDIIGKLDLQEVEKAVEETKKRILSMNKNDESKRFLEHVFQRLDKYQHLYTTKSLLMEEYIADISKIIMFYQYEPHTKETIQKTIQPLLGYFDQHFIPKLEQYILKDKNRALIEIPKSLEAPLKILEEKNQNKQASRCFGLTKRLASVFTFNP
jgi:hypothetical protein